MTGSGRKGEERLCFCPSFCPTAVGSAARLPVRRRRARLLATETHQHSSSLASKPAGHYLCPWVTAEKATHQNPGCAPRLNLTPALAERSRFRTREPCGLPCFHAAARGSALHAGSRHSCPAAGVGLGQREFPILLSVEAVFPTPRRSCCFQTELWGAERGREASLRAPCVLQTLWATSWWDGLDASGSPSLDLSFPSCEMDVMVLLSSGSARRIRADVNTISPVALRHRLLSPASRPPDGNQKANLGRAGSPGAWRPFITT